MFFLLLIESYVKDINPINLNLNHTNQNNRFLSIIITMLMDDSTYI